MDGGNKDTWLRIYRCVYWRKVATRMTTWPSEFAEGGGVGEVIVRKI